MTDDKIIAELKQVAHSNGIDRVQIAIDEELARNACVSSYFNGHVQFVSGRYCGDPNCSNFNADDTHIDIKTSHKIYVKYILAHEVGHAVYKQSRFGQDGVLHDECLATQWAIRYLRSKIKNKSDWSMGVEVYHKALDTYFNMYAYTRYLKSIRKKYILK